MGIRIRNPFRSRVKARERDYSEQETAAQFAAVVGGVGRPECVSAIEACLALYDRSARAVRWNVEWWHGGHTAMAIRDLLTRGRALFWPRPTATGYLPTPAADVAITGRDPDPAKWDYELQIPMPTDSRVVKRKGNRVWHFLLGQDARNPSLGRSPLDRAIESSQLVSAIGASLRDEFQLPSARLIGGAGMPNQEQREQLQEAVKGSGGTLLMLPSARVEMNMAPARTETAPAVLQPAPSAGALAIRRQVLGELCECLGVPADLIVADTPLPGPSVIQLHRRYLATGLGPLLEIIRAELAMKTQMEITFDVSELRASDQVQLARAVHTLTQSGMDFETALEQLGWGRE